VEAQPAETPAAQTRSERAVRVLTERLEQMPEDASALYSRGCYHFFTGQFENSVHDFDQYVALQPEAERRLWERGISHYYAGKYKAGAEQFALYQTYHDNDVENAVWRYLCQKKVDGEEKARGDLLPIKNDPRIPLMTVYSLFQGKAKPQDVLAAIGADNPTGSELESRQFYGRLYLGLYFEAHGQPELGRKYLHEAWTEHAENGPFSGYMWNVARVHCMHTTQEKAAAGKN